jgi:hypothetical protein
MLESARLIPWAARVSVDAVEVEVGAKVGDAVCTGLGTDTLELAAVLAAAGLNAATDAVSVDRAVAISRVTVADAESTLEFSARSLDRGRSDGSRLASLLPRLRELFRSVRLLGRKGSVAVLLVSAMGSSAFRSIGFSATAPFIAASSVSEGVACELVFASRSSPGRFLSSRRTLACSRASISLMCVSSTRSWVFSTAASAIFCS